MNKFIDLYKIDNAYPMTNVTTAGSSSWYPLKESRMGAFVVSVGQVATGSTITCQLWQATDFSGSNAKVIVNSTCTITAGINASRISVAMGSAIAGDTVTINGLTFTAHATTTTVANREFSIAGDAGAELCTCVNDSTYGVPNVSGYGSGDNAFISACCGEDYITVSSSVNINTFSTSSVALLEIQGADIDDTNGYGFIRCVAAVSATCYIVMDLFRDRSRYTPKQYLAASKTDVS